MPSLVWPSLLVAHASTCAYGCLAAQVPICSFRPALRSTTIAIPSARA